MQCVSRMHIRVMEGEQGGCVNSIIMSRMDLLRRMLTYDRQTMDEVQTASNEDPIEMQVEDADVDVDLFHEKWNKEDGKVLSDQNTGNKRKDHSEQGSKEKILSEQNQEKEAKKRGRRRWDQSIGGSKDRSIDQSVFVIE
jgi:hypothetical protein